MQCYSWVGLVILLYNMHGFARAMSRRSGHKTLLPGHTVSCCAFATQGEFIIVYYKFIGSGKIYTIVKKQKTTAGHLSLHPLQRPVLSIPHLHPDPLFQLLIGLGDMLLL